ncbi:MULTISPECIES: SIP domain-containing protein [unclassified Rhizobium]|uniref:SIP domain-containing protein n=1 Tax=Rhizobium sp. Leaf453 TaxID=1736380 RepID=UPI000B0133C6
MLAGDKTAFPAIARILENLPERQERGRKAAFRVPFGNDRFGSIADVYDRPLCANCGQR